MPEPPPTEEETHREEIAKETRSEKQSAKGLESFFKTAKQKQVGAIIWPSGRLFFSERKRIADEGGLMPYGENFTDLYRRAAVYVDKTLKGTKPAWLAGAAGDEV